MINDMRPKVSFGNKKLPKDTLIFNLPAVVTCPGRTAFCREKCYALKAQRQYTNTRLARGHNLLTSYQSDFVDLMIETIKENAHKIKQIRIHESGDFYRQDYLDKWFEIVRAFPTVPFWAYTKSFHLDFSKKPPNLFLLASFDASTTPTWRGLYERQKKFFNSTFSIVEKTAPASCVQDCSKCSLCWTTTGKDLTVNLH